MSNPLAAAIRRLVLSELDDETSGNYVGLRAFIDPGRGDIYIEGINGERLCISAAAVRYSQGEWDEAEAPITL